MAWSPIVVNVYSVLSDGQFQQLKQEIQKMSAALDTLRAQVTAVQDRGDATIALLNGIAAQLREHLANNNIAAIEQMSAELEAQVQEFNTAIEANTTPPAPPVEPPVVEPPVEEPTPEPAPETPTE